MTCNEYQEEMRRTYKPDRKANHALGLAGEAAEIAVNYQQKRDELDRAFDAMVAAGKVSEAVKKDVFHARPLDPVQLRDELGDLLWYIAATACDYGLTLSEVAETNVAKLRARYPEGFVPGGGIR